VLESGTAAPIFGVENILPPLEKSRLVEIKPLGSAYKSSGNDY
jgi:hypothetical protein